MDRIRHEAPAWRGEKWVPPENLHLTLAFLGSLTDPQLAEVTDVVISACARVERYTLALGQTCAIPRLRKARMVWVTAEGGARDTTDLALLLARALEPTGYQPPDRPFSPHITLVRSRQPQTMPFEAIDAANRLLFASEERDAAMSVRGVTVYSSTLSPRGPVYDELAFAPLRG